MTVVASKSVEAAIAGFFEPMSHESQVPLRQDQSQALLTLLTAQDDAKATETLDKMCANGVFAAQLAKARLTAYSRSSTSAVGIMLAVSATSPGEITMLISYAMYKLIGTEQAFDLNSFCNVFAMGLYSRDQYDRLWDGQKGFRHGLDVDNLLDSADVVDWLNSKD